MENIEKPNTDDVHESITSLLNKCWDNDPEKRPNSQEVIDIIEDIIIDSSLSDPESSTFWKLNFKGQTEVPFDNFAKSLYSYLGLTFPRDDKSKEDDVEYKCLREMISVKKDDSTRIVRIEDFNIATKRFGPLKQKDDNLVNLIKTILEQPWYFGDLNGSQATSLLKGQKKKQIAILLDTLIRLRINLF